MGVNVRIGVGPGEVDEEAACVWRGGGSGFHWVETDLLH